ncbi:hypothetical protein [Streptomyces sp. NRRL S-495]|uniref:hypothetical protein n=1 Tax=Streptomyces sp. NRRL S-495 TaxID=1609133 RepID=UPI00069637F8|nr:hypothetical protein [Streptomyces sp. NRRL S-495]
MEASLAALAPQLQLSRPGPLVPVLPALESLLPEAGLRPGAVVSVSGGGTALLLALAAAATTSGTWCAALGFEGLGLLAAAELGIDLAHLVVVEAPGERWAQAALALADGVGLLLLRPAGPVDARVAERLVTVARRASCALVVDGPWPGARVRLRVASRSWEGLGQGRGRLRARRVVVLAGGRGAAARERRLGLWLPDAHGAVRVADPAARDHAPAVPAGRSSLAVV